jgi:hypothetical protein
MCHKPLKMGQGGRQVSYQTIYYRDSKGRQPVDEAIDELPEQCQELLDDQILLLNSIPSDRHLPYPQTSAIKGDAYRELREIRGHCGKNHHRILFAQSGRFLVLLHLVPYKKGDIPETAKEIALKRWRDFQARMDADPPARPRAMGHDAP